MDPYLEAHWGDVHARLIVHAAERLQAALPGDLRARVEERVFVQSTDDYGRSVYPDVRVIERPRRSAAPAPPGGLIVAEPVIVHVPDEPVTETFIEIREAGTGHRVITVIEILSLSNKTPGEGQALYLQKRKELKQGGVSLVEIDLLRGGQHVQLVPPRWIPPAYRSTYRICVRRAWSPTAVEVYAAPLRERLPVIPVPLRDTDDDAPLDLQAVVDQSYAGAGYDDIDYRAEPIPALEPEDAAWMEALLREKG
ncbi:MAG: DUF4058 family protein, partial [Actinobacteria bacterium]|nr:DUF4058 family protein [Actinomycetota bacterium]